MYLLRDVEPAFHNVWGILCLLFGSLSSLAMDHDGCGNSISNSRHTHGHAAWYAQMTAGLRCIHAIAVDTRLFDRKKLLNVVTVTMI